MVNTENACFAFFVRVCNSKFWDGTTNFVPNEREDELIRLGLNNPDFTFLDPDSERIFAFGHMAADQRFNRKGGSTPGTPYVYSKGTGLGFVGTNNEGIPVLVLYPEIVKHLTDASIKLKLPLFKLANAERARLASTPADINGSAEVNIKFTPNSPSSNHKIIPLDNLGVDFSFDGVCYQHNSTKIRLNKVALDKAINNFKQSVVFNQF